MDDKERFAGAGVRGAATLSDRVSRLRSQVCRLPEICTQRAYWWTKSYEETEGQPEIIRRAKALAKVLENMSIRIGDDELIVGATTSKARGAMVFPEIQWEYVVREADLVSSRDWDTFDVVSEDDKETLRTTLPYWAGKCVWDRFNASMPDEIKKLHGGVFRIGTGSMSGVHVGHETIDYERALILGFNGIREEVQAKLAELDLADSQDFKKYQFFTAVCIALDAGAAFAVRYAGLAREMAAKQEDTRRRAELQDIATVCERVSTAPAGSFREALQAIWFVHIMLRNEAFGRGLGFGRLDQYLYPLFKKDIDEHRLTTSDALELLESFLVKVNDMVEVTGSSQAEAIAGFPIMVSMTLGGVTPDGKDAVNELSYLFLEAEQAVNLSADEVTVRVSRSNCDAFLMRALEVSKNLHGKFKFVSDNTIINQLLSEGRSIEHARDYVFAGCFTPAVPSCALEITAGQINGPLMLELALNNGMSRLTGQQMGPVTGDPREFRSYEDVWRAFERQVEFFMHLAVAARNIDMALYEEFLACPFMSAFMNPCVDRGTDIMAGGTAPYIREGYGLAGLPNIGDSLAAVKKVVFDDKVTDMSGLVDALERNFEGDARLLQALRLAPKFGNDDDYVDSIVNDIIGLFDTELAKHKGLAGSTPALALATATGHLIMGRGVGATPEGRLAGEPFAEGGISPHQGRNVCGPTATLRSVAKLDLVKARGGSVLNMKFNPDALDAMDKKVRFLSMLRTYCETGGFHVQFNIVSATTLRRAQKNPEAYRDLLVRVATYSAKFVELSPRMQEDILSRVEFQ